MVYVTRGCFFSGFGFGRKKEDGIRPAQLPVLADHAFAALWSTETPSASSTGILPAGETGGAWTECVPCPMSWDRKVDLFGLSRCACCMVNSVKGLTHSYAGPSLLSLTSNVTATQI